MADQGTPLHNPPPNPLPNPAPKPPQVVPQGPKNLRLCQTSNYWKVRVLEHLHIHLENPPFRFFEDFDQRDEICNGFANKLHIDIFLFKFWLDRTIIPIRFHENRIPTDYNFENIANEYGQLSPHFTQRIGIIYLHSLFNEDKRNGILDLQNFIQEFLFHYDLLDSFFFKDASKNLIRRIIEHKIPFSQKRLVFGMRSKDPKEELIHTSLNNLFVSYSITEKKVIEYFLRLNLQIPPAYGQIPPPSLNVNDQPNRDRYYVYIFRDNQNRFKVGSSNNVLELFRTLATGNPDLQFVWCTERNYPENIAASIEKESQRRLTILGRFYRPPPPLVNRLYVNNAQEWFHQTTIDEIIHTIYGTILYHNVPDTDVNDLTTKMAALNVNVN